MVAAADGGLALRAVDGGDAVDNKVHGHGCAVANARACVRRVEAQGVHEEAARRKEDGVKPVLPRASSTRSGKQQLSRGPR